MHVRRPHDDRPAVTRRSRGFLRGALLAAVTAGLVAVALLGGRDAGATRASSPPAVQASTAVVMDQVTGVVVYSKDPDRRLPMASCTKIMTALIVLERIRDRSRFVRVPAAAVGAPGATIGLRAGDRITVHTLLAGMLTRSATDCAITLATAVAGNERAFVVLMNRRAAALGLSNTHYANSSGIAASRHFTSARDLASVSRVAMRLRAFRDLVKPVSATLLWPPDHVLRVESHNELNRHYRWVDGIKTGASVLAKRCLASSGTYGARRFIVTTLREQTRAQETIDHVLLYHYAASLYAQRTVVAAGAEITRVPLDGGGEVVLTAATSLLRLLRSEATVKVRLAVPASFALPPVAGSVVGTATYSADGQRLGVVQVLAAGPGSPPASPQP